MIEDFPENYDKSNQITIEISARQFEEMIATDSPKYFDEETYESLSDYYLLQGKIEMALNVCTVGLENYPYSLDLALNKAQVLMSTGDLEESLSLIEKAAIFNPSDSEVVYMKGTVLNLMGQYDEALSLLEECLLFSEDKDNVYFQIAQTYKSKNDFGKAIENFKKSLEVDIKNEITFFELIFSIEFNDSLEDELIYFQSLVDNDPYSYYAWYYLGIILNRIHQYDEAIKAFDYSVVIKDDFTNGWFNLGHSYMNIEDYENAKISYLKTFEKEEPTAEVATHVGAVYEKLGEWPLAYKYYKKASELDEEWDDAWYGMASVLFEQEKWLEAIHFAKKATSLDPNNGGYWLMQADVETKLGNVVSAIEAYSKASLLEAGNVDVWLNWSLTYFEKEDYSRAFEIIFDGIEEIPDEAELHYRAAIYLLYDSSFNEAYKYLQDALSLDYGMHEVIYDFFPNLKTQKALFRIIEQYKDQ